MIILIGMLKNKNLLILSVSLLLLLMGFIVDAGASQSSTNYSIQSNVLSGGIGEMGSTNYSLWSTLGQSTPPIDQADTPYSTYYDLYSGFWYTIGVAIPQAGPVTAMPWIPLLLLGN
jgi:hypothetical protein